MSEPLSRLPSRPSLEHLRKQAKDLLRLYRAGDAAALGRLHTAVPRLLREATPVPILADAQLAIAREHGFESWPKLVEHVEALQSSILRDLEQIANDVARAYIAADREAIQSINARHGTSFPWDRDATKMKRQLPRWFAAGASDPALALTEVRDILARKLGEDSWAGLVASVTGGARGSGSTHASATFYRIDEHENRVEIRRPLTDAEWDVVVAVVREREISRVEANMIGDSGLARLASAGSVTHITLASETLTDDGLRHLGRMPQLRHLEMGGWRSPITDRGMEAVANLPELRTIRMCWTQRVTDAGYANLEFCQQLETVDLLGTHAGDGMLAALAGKPRLRYLKTGRGVTDAGMAHLHRIPAFKSWQGGEPEYSLMSPDSGPTHLLIDGPFTDAGLAALAGLDGLFGLSVFWHSPRITSAGLAGLAGMTNLGFLGCEGRNCDDLAMQHIAAIPQLRMLMGQGAVATDAGFEALSRSETLEYFWGRDCPNLGGRGFAAFARMPALQGLAVTLKNVDDAGLSTLPRFPSLTKLMPMDVTDDGFRHVGRCERLESLWCMYCRDTGDVATRHIRSLPRLKTYYAGATQITDTSLKILGGMESLEKLEFWACTGVTNTGVAALARLPRLKELSLDGLAQVTREVAAMFPPTVRVRYSP